MGFKLGKGKRPTMYGGTIRSKMRFGQEAGGDASVPGTPVIRRPLEEGVLGEANMDGSIYISDKIQPGSEEERQVVNHEMRHATDMKTGKLAYGDDFVKFNGVTYPRMTIDGKDMIIVDGVAKEAGDGGFPWEDDANNGTEPAV
tara:strand:+ start:372 stop:803 length:432 start_codon:yes stop_codon:yes gene_type:complete